MRVHELAKEYNVTSKEIIKTLIDNREKSTGKTGKWSHLSGLSNDQIVKLGYIMQSGDTIVETEYKEELESDTSSLVLEELSEDDDYDEKGPIDFDEEAAKENGTELSMEPEKDDWTLGSGDVIIEGDKIGIDPEKIQEAVETNVKAASDAREKYAETVDAITKDPEGWASGWDPDKNDGQPDDEEETDSELSFGQKAFAKAKAEETTDEIKEVIVERPTGFFGWLKGLFS